MHPNSRALVLAWDGEPMRPGAWYLSDALLDADSSPDWRWIERAIRAGLGGKAWRLRNMARDIGATIIVVGSDGREVNSGNE